MRGRRSAQPRRTTKRGHSEVLRETSVTAQSWKHERSEIASAREETQGGVRPLSTAHGALWLTSPFLLRLLGGG